MLLATGKGFRLCGGDKGGAAPLDPLQPLEKAGETFILAGETFIFLAYEIDKTNFLEYNNHMPLIYGFGG